MSRDFILFPEQFNYCYTNEYLIFTHVAENRFYAISGHDTLDQAIEYIESGILDNPYNAVIYGWDSCRFCYRVYPIHLIDPGR